jgi:hypothetical protein
MKLIGSLNLWLLTFLVGFTISHTGCQAQTVTRPGLAPGSSWTFTRDAQGVTLSRQGTHFSFSRSVGTANSATASASASASDPNRAFASSSTSASVRTNANGQSIDMSRARAVAIGKNSSTSAVTTNGGL